VVDGAARRLVAHDDAPLGLRRGAVLLAASNPAWSEIVAGLAAELTAALAPSVCAVEHMGSTAVPGLDTKPIVDIGVLLAPDAGDVIAPIEALGYEYRFDMGNEGGLVFALGPQTRRVALLHVVRAGDPQWIGYLAFREQLRTDRPLREAYAVRKRALARQYPHDREAYTAAKAAFVNDAIDGNVITTARMQMRLMTNNDVDLLVDLGGDPEVMRFLTGGRPTTPAEVADRIRVWLGSRWAAFDDCGSFIGWFGVRPTDEAQQERELGYGMRRQWWGRGLATEGALAMIDHAFNRFRAARVWAQTMTVNTRSRAVMERCGLHYVRTFHAEWDETIPGGEDGDVEYEITRSEWEAARTT
jgi:GrpB-like predicted nucleotidyltransferase (UPF0157 family)/RimJ/RimL family protein N-acetyltransferase